MLRNAACRMFSETFYYAQQKKNNIEKKKTVPSLKKKESSDSVKSFSLFLEHIFFISVLKFFANFHVGFFKFAKSFKHWIWSNPRRNSNNFYSFHNTTTKNFCMVLFYGKWKFIISKARSYMNYSMQYFSK